MGPYEGNKEYSQSLQKLQDLDVHDEQLEKKVQILAKKVIESGIEILDPVSVIEAIEAHAGETIVQQHTVEKVLSEFSENDTSRVGDTVRAARNIKAAAYQ